MTAERFFYLVLTTAVLAGSSLAQGTTQQGVPFGSASAAPVAKEGLSGGIPIPAIPDLVEGTWTALHIWKGKTWKNKGTVQIQKDEATGKLYAKWTDNSGGDNPEWNGYPKNAVTFSGTTVTLHRELSNMPKDDPETSQTWEGTLYKSESGESGNIKIEGHVRGTWIKWETEQNKNANTFLLVKQVVEKKPSH